MDRLSSTAAVDDLTGTAGIVALAAAGVAVVALILAIVLARPAAAPAQRPARRARRPRARATSSPTPPSSQSAFAALHELRRGRRRPSSTTRMATAEHRLDGAIAYRALVRYDAYGEMSGHQSTSIALLDADALRRRALLDPPPRPGAPVRQAGARRRAASIELSPEEDEAVRLALAGERSAGAGRRARADARRLPRPRGHVHARGAARAGRRRRRSSPSRCRPSTTTVHGRARRRASTARSCRSRTRSRARSTPTLDALALETDDVAIVGELVHPVRHCLIAARPARLDRDRDRPLAPAGATRSAPASCATRCRRRGVRRGSSTAEAVRTVAERDGRRARRARHAARRRALRRARAARRRRGRAGQRDPLRLARARGRADADAAGDGPWKTALVFWGAGAERAGLARALPVGVRLRAGQPHADRVAPAQQGLGRYMFFLDLEGRGRRPPVAEALEALRGARRGAARARLLSGRD